MEAWSSDVDKAVPQTYVFWDGRGHTAFITFSKYLRQRKAYKSEPFDKKENMFLGTRGVKDLS